MRERNKGGERRKGKRWIYNLMINEIDLKSQ